MKDKQGRKKSFLTSTAKVEMFSLPDKCNLKGVFSEKKILKPANTNTRKRKKFEEVATGYVRIGQSR
jgi:hypothetical protein